MTENPVRHADTIIFPASLDPKAVTVVERLTEAGFESYLVGGCVRDLLLGHIPKDFDVSTEARPRQIRRVFRNCRVIGRRFKLAHVHFGTKIIEVATFRRNPDDLSASDGNDSDQDGDSDWQTNDGDIDSDDPLIVRDNVYGTSEEDARRRDFTMNALLYDVGTGEVIDWVGGVPDLERRVLATIGDPALRIAEDPVRMLRAIKFTARLGLTLDPALEQAMAASAGLISKSAPPRVLEEIHKLLSCGKAEHSLDMLRRFGLLELLLPELGRYYKDRADELSAVGRAIDHVDRGQRRLGNALLLSALYHGPWRALLDANEGNDPQGVARDLIQPTALVMSIPRRDVARMKALLAAQLRLESPRRGRRVRMGDFLNRTSTQEAVDLLYLRALAGGVDPELHAEWGERLAWCQGEPVRDDERDDDSAASDAPGTGRKRRRRRRGGRRNRRGGEDHEQDAGSESGSERSSEPRRERSGRTRRPRAAETAAGESMESSEHPAQPQSAATAAPGPAAQRSPPAAESKPVSALDERPAKGGLRKFVGRLMRKVLGAEAPPAPKPQRADATSASTPPAAHSAAQKSVPSAGEAPTANPAQSDAQSPPAPHGGDREDGGPRRRKRRRRRSGRGRSAEGGADGEQTSSLKSGQEADVEGGDSPSSKPGGSPRPEGERSPRKRRSRGGRSRSGKGREAGQEPRDAGASGEKAESSSNRPGRPRGGRGGNGRGDNGSSGGRKPRPGRSDGTSVTRPKVPKEDDGSNLARHPEDVEDIFDW